MNGKNDLTTLLVPHLKTLRSATAKDDTTNVKADITTMEAVQLHAAKDVNSDYYVYLQSHA